MSEDYVTIGEMCKEFDVTPRTLRFYESKELISPKREGTRRLFGRRERARLKLILRGKRFGFSLEQTRQLLEMYNIDTDNVTQKLKTREVAYERLNAMIAQRDELTQAIDELTQRLEHAEFELAQHTTDKAAE